MTRRGWLCALTVLAALIGWAVFRPGTSRESEYGVQTEEVAAKRWMTNQPTHWRRIVVSR